MESEDPLFILYTRYLILDSIEIRPCCNINLVLFMILVDLPVNLKVFFIPLPDTWFMQQLLLNMSSIINLPMSISVLPMSDGLLDILTLFTVHF